MSKELRKKSKKNIGNLVNGDSGNWLYLSKAGSEPPVLFLSAANGKIDKTLAEGREVQAKGEFALSKGSFYLHVKTGKIDIAAIKAGIDPGFQWEIGRPPDEKAPKSSEQPQEESREKQDPDGDPEDPKTGGSSEKDSGESEQSGNKEPSDQEEPGEESGDGLDDLLDDAEGLEELLASQRKGKEKPGAPKKEAPKKEEKFKATIEKAKARARFLARQEGEVEDLDALLLQAAKEGDLDAMDYFRALGFSDEELRDPDFSEDDLLDLDEGSEDPGDDDLDMDELPEDEDPELPKKVAKKLKKRTDQQKALLRECTEAARLYQEALLKGAQDVEPSAPTRRARARLEQARADALAWLEASAKEIAKNRSKKSDHADIQRAGRAAEAGDRADQRPC
jgi:hypothetical protein